MRYHPSAASRLASAPPGAGRLLAGCKASLAALGSLAFGSLVLLGFPLPARAAQPLPAPVAQALSVAKIPPGAVAVVVQDIEAPRPSLSVQAKAPMNPASVMKLVTTYASLAVLGPAYRWKTEAWVNGGLREGVLEGELILRGGGDPKLDLEAFWRLLRGLRERGLRDIRGDLVLDRSLFERPQGDSGSFDGDAYRPYNVLPDALLVNYRSLRFAFAPDAEQGVVRLSVDPRPPALELVNSLVLANGPCPQGAAFRELLKASFDPARQRAIFSGRYPINCGEKDLNVALLAANDHISGVLRQLWSELGGTWLGAAREGRVAAGARLLHTLESPPLAEIVRDINKFSNNVMARQLYLTLGAEQPPAATRAAGSSGTGATSPSATVAAGSSGTVATGSSATSMARPAATGEQATATIRSWLSSAGIAAPELVLENGAGLSRVERISASSLAALLQSAWRSALMPEFIASLPIAAVDGTLRRRLQGSGVAGQAHLKTGLLADVRAMAGYLQGRDGRRKIVVMIVNHANAHAAQPALDALLLWAYEQ